MSPPGRHANKNFLQRCQRQICENTRAVSSRFFLFMFLTLVYFTSYGIIAVAVSPNVQMAAVLSSTFYSLWCASPVP